MIDMNNYLNSNRNAPVDIRKVIIMALIYVAKKNASHISCVCESAE